MSKNFEHIIFNRLLSFFQRNKILIPAQFGFRNNHSTLYPILDIMTQCYDNIHHKRFSTLLFLNIKKAFDSVCHKKLLTKLNFYGIRGVANTLISSYLRNRKQFVCINTEFSTFKSIELGVPQGSILGPFLFLVYINDLLLSLKSVPRLFAEDTALCINENLSKNLEILANQELKNINLCMVSMV